MWSEIASVSCSVVDPGTWSSVLCSEVGSGIGSVTGGIVTSSVVGFAVGSDGVVVESETEVVETLEVVGAVVLSLGVVVVSKSASMKMIPVIGTTKIDLHEPNNYTSTAHLNVFVN